MPPVPARAVPAISPMAPAGARVVRPTMEFGVSVDVVVRVVNAPVFGVPEPIGFGALHVNPRMSEARETNLG